MFGNSKNEQNNKAGGVISTSSSSSSNSLVQGTNVEGNVQADKDIRIDGTLKGSLQCKGKVIIGPTGHIIGDVTCENAVIEGRFEGVLMVSDVLHVKETAKIEGDVSTSKLVVQPGSIFNVKCKMGSQPNGISKKVSLSEEDSMELNTLGKSKAAMS
jgi:cytoskeletal protein CcmA (bactofilin family)